MWDTNTVWFEISVVCGTIALGHILLGHFEERTPRLKKFGKFIGALILVTYLSKYFGQGIALLVYGLLYIPVLWIHIIYLPKKGINGWTGEPKSRYYELRKWNKDLFEEK